jgi:hypothetical protein
VRVDRRRLDSLELPPFRSLIAGGLGGMMVAHLNVPALDTVPGPSTLSQPIIKELAARPAGLQRAGFHRCHEHERRHQHVSHGEADVRALIAGQRHFWSSAKTCRWRCKWCAAAVDSGRHFAAGNDGHCRRVLALKQWAGLNRYRPIDTQNLYQEPLTPPTPRYLSHRLTELSQPLLRTRAQPCLPLQRLDTLRICHAGAGGLPRATPPTSKAVADYAPTACFHASATPTLDELTKLREALKPYNLVLVALQNLGRLPATNFGITPETNLLLRELIGQKQQLVLTVFGSAYAVAKVRELDRASAVVLAYQESPDAQNLAVQALFGGIAATGRLPVTVSGRYPRGFGLRTAGNLRLRYAHPEDVGLDGRLGARVDSLVGRALAAQAFPGRRW